ncbi:hypothetical protein [Streptomyces sp. NPDC057580]|uniref:hypothetical protein n=1 Tax=Streptomyces sp. NPDC057580 TaxID=3346173 RepID=UPI0036AC8F4D
MFETSPEPGAARGRGVTGGAESVGSTWKLSREEGGALAGRWWKWALSATVAEATASLNGIPLPLQEFSAPFRMGLIRRYAWGIWGGIAAPAPGHP